eukprot:gi/632973218/ref/XP_007903045.1/ PREDICTED: hematological and neurological expressed 1-like protein [Callorhinchus milii]
MTSTGTFAGLTGRGSSSRVLKPPGGGSSNIFGDPDDSSAGKSYKMASNIFGPPDETQVLPKRSNPPGGKDSGIFSDSGSQQQHTLPPGGINSNIFGESVPSVAVHVNPHKPKDTHVICGDEEEKEKLKGAEIHKEQDKKKEEDQEMPVEEKQKAPAMDQHEPRLGPIPRSHNKVTQPPGGNSTLWLF